MIYRSLMTAVATIGIAVASGCCGMYPCGYGVGCGHGGCGMGACAIEPPCCDGGGCDSCGISGPVGGGCGSCAGGIEPCGMCGTGSCLGSCAQGFLSFARQSIHNVLTCGSGCGELYIDEWYSDPPDACDPCVDCARANCAPPGCGFYPSVPWNLWGRRFQGGSCQSCEGSYVAEYTEPAEYVEPAGPQNPGSCPGGCGSLTARLFGRPISRMATTPGHPPTQRIHVAPSRANHPVQVSHRVEPYAP